ncbi:MAG: transposase [Geminicoccaceae bacterium]
MALGRQNQRQAELMIGWGELPHSPGHAFYDRLQTVLTKGAFDSFVELQCAPFYATRQGRPSLPPGRYFRMHLVGYIEGIDSERGLEWRCSDSLSLREFLRLGTTEPVPDHSWLSRTRSRLPLELHEAVFTWVLQRLDEHGLITGGRIGVDASTIEANAALRTIVRRDTGESYRSMLERLAAASGVATPTAEDLVQLDRKRAGKRLSNAYWISPSDPEAKSTRLKDGRTRLAYKPEHAVDLDTAAIVAAEIHGADRGDTATLPDTLQAAESHLAMDGAAPQPDDPAELVADKGYHSRDRLKELEDSAWKSRIAEKKVACVSRWYGDEAAKRAVYNNRARLRSGVARDAFKLRVELVGRSFALVLDRGGLRRVWLRGRDDVHKRYLIHVAGYNFGLIMRLLIGAGTPREFAAGGCACWLLVAHPTDVVTAVLIVADNQPRCSSSASRQNNSTTARLHQRAVRLPAPPARSAAGSAGS